MTIKPLLSRGALRWLGASAVAVAALVGATLPAFADFGTTACTFRNNDISNSLRQSIADKLGISRTQVEIPIIVVPTFNNNLGQPISLAGITLCTNNQLVEAPSSSSESVPFPSTGSPPFEIQEIQQTSYVLVNGNLMRICQSDQETGCVEIKKK